MKLFFIPLCAVLLFTQCTSINLRMMKDRLPAVGLLKFEQPDLTHKRSAVYKTPDTTIQLTAIEKEDGTMVLMVRDSADDREIMVNGERMKKNELSYEYHFSDKGAVTDVYLTGGKSVHQKLDQSLIPAHDTQLVSEKKGFTILTHAGKFDCVMRVEKENGTYYVYFLNPSVLGRAVRCHILDEDGYRAFAAMDQRNQESYLSKDMIEIYSASAK